LVRYQSGAGLYAVQPAPRWRASRQALAWSRRAESALVMRVLVGCEYSGIVRDAFIAAGHDAMSCDLEPSETPGPHYQGDVRDVLDGGWTLGIFHPPCTHLASSGARWFSARRPAQLEAIDFVRTLLASPIPHIALENPIGVLSTAIGPPSQIVQPFEYGHGETKATCLWLRGLPKLQPTNMVAGREQRIHRMSPGPNRSRERSRTYPGIARAMAEQWSNADAFAYQMAAPW